MKIKSLIVCAVLAICTLSAKAQISGYDRVGTTLETSKDKITAVQKNGLWGFVDAKGKEKIAPTYKSVGSKDNNVGAIDVQSTNGKWGMVSSKGKEIIKPEFDKIWGFRKSENKDNPFGGSKYRAIAVKDGKVCIIDQKGNIQAGPYESVYTPQVTMYRESSNNSWTILSPDKYKVDRKENWALLLSPLTSSAGDKYYYVIPSHNKVYIKEGYFLIDPSTGKYGLVPSGKVLPDCKYDELKCIDERGSRAYAAKKDGKWGVLHYGSEVWAPFEFDDAKYQYPFTYVQKGGKWGVYFEGKVFLPVEYEEIKPFGQSYMNMHAVKQNGLWGLVDKAGKQLIDCKYTEISVNQGDNYYKVTLPDGKSRIYDTIDKKLLPAGVDDVMGYVHGVGPIVKKNGLCGIMYENGTMALPAKYKTIYQLNGYKDPRFYVVKTSDTQLSVMYVSGGKLVTAVPMGQFTEILNEGQNTKFIVGRKGKTLGAYCLRGKKLTPMVTANEIHFAGSKVYFASGTGSRGTIYCFGSDGKSYGSYTGNSYGVANFIRKTSTL